ncbi:hypothetical protein Tco_0472664, partial [Tanacetum coccineum]
LEIVIKNGNKVLKRTVGETEQEYEPTTAKEKQDMRNEMKARGTLLLALSNKDQLKFHSYKNAKLLMKAIEKRYRGNKESKKVQRTLLKQQYENFARLSSEIMDQTFDRLKKLISQLEIQGEVITQEDMNLKLLRSLPSEWKTHALIWRNKQEIETISLDELYNNLKIYEPEISGSSSTSQNPQNVAFVSSNSINSNSSTNEADNTAYGVSAAHTQSNLASGDNLSDAVICEMAMLTIRARRFIKRIGKKLDENRGKENNRRTVTVETPTENALVAQDRIRGYDWSYQAEEVHPTNFALMALTSSGSSSSSDFEVDSCSKSCVKAYATLKEQYDRLSLDYKKSQFNLVSYKACLESVEARLAHYKKNEAVYEESINFLNLEVKLRDNALVENKKKLEKAEKERDALKLTLEKFQNSSKSLNNLLESQVSVKFKTRLGYNTTSSTVASSVVESFVNSSEMNFIPFKLDLTFMDEIVESENMDVITIVTPSNGKKVKLNHESAAVEPKTVRKNNFRPPAVLTKSSKINTADASVNTAVRPVNTAGSKTTVNNPRPISKAYKKGYLQVTNPFNKYSANKTSIFNKKVNIIRVKDTTARYRAVGNPQQKEYKEKGVIDSGCSRTMTRNNAHLIEYKDYDGGFVSFRDGKGRISRKREIPCRGVPLKILNVTILVLLSEGIQHKASCLSIKPHNRHLMMYFMENPLIDFMKPFRYPVTILYTRDHLGKFDGKAYEGFYVGYSMVSKAMRVFNKRTRIVEETLNIRLLENTPNVTGNGPDWLFNIDSLTISMNYMPVAEIKLMLLQELEIILLQDSEEDVGMKPTEVNESRASDKGEEDEQDIRSEFERLLQQEKQTNSNNSFNIVGTPVSTIGPSFTNDDPSTPVNAADASNAFEDRLFERFSPFKNALALPYVPNVFSIDDTGIFGNAYDDEDVGVEVDLNNLEITMNVSPILTTRIDKDHPKDKIIGDLNSAI